MSPEPFRMQQAARSQAPAWPWLALFLGGLWAGLWAPVAGAAGVLQFIEPRLALAEGEQTEITVVRSGSAEGPATVVLNVSLGGTATLGDDFSIELPLGVISIPDGELFGRALVEAPAQDGGDGTRYAVLTLANPSGATLGRDTSLLLQIEDPDTPAASLEFPGEAVQRVTAGEELPLEVRREGLEEETVTVTLLGVPNTAALGIDYSDLTVNLEFAPGETLAEATLFTLERDEATFPRSLNLLLASPEPAGEAAFSGLAPLVVIEEPIGERAGEFSLFAENREAGEEDASILLTVDRNRGSTGTATVDWVTVDGPGPGDAVAGEDYVASTGTLVFAEGETRKTFSVELLADPDTARDRRSFEVTLANPSALAGIDPEARRETLVITADEGVNGDECRGFCECFIATAAWGSWMDPHVVSLRRFRDQVLMQNAPGRAFVAFYYRHSPPAAEFIARHGALRAVARGVLAPVVFAVERPATAAGSVLLALLLLLNLRRAAARRRAT